MKLHQYDPPLTGLQLRGQQYGVVKLQVKDTLIYLFRQRVHTNGKILPVEVVQFAAAVGLPVKTTFEFLEQYGLLHSGTYERFDSVARWKLGQWLESFSKCPMESLGYECMGVSTERATSSFDTSCIGYFIIDNQIWVGEWWSDYELGNFSA